MADWKKVVGQHMTQMNLPASVQGEVIDELAAHLEDSEHDRSSNQVVGSEENEAVRWKELARAICSAKGNGGTMHQRTIKLWLPVMANLTLYTIMMYIGAFCFDERIWTPRISAGSHTPLPIFHPWLFMLPICGALGALVAKRSDASRGTLLVAGLAPSIIWFAVFAIMGLVLVCAPNDFKGFPLSQIALAAFGWVIIPALLLFLGTVPFLRTARA